MVCFWQCNQCPSPFEQPLKKGDQLDPLRRRVLPYLHTIGMLCTFSQVRYRMTAMQVLNTKGAARRLGCSETWIHKLVSAGKLKAYTYNDNGVLVERARQMIKGKVKDCTSLLVMSIPTNRWSNADHEAAKIRRYQCLPQSPRALDAPMALAYCWRFW